MVEMMNNIGQQRIKICLEFKNNNYISTIQTRKSKQIVKENRIIHLMNNNQTHQVNITTIKTSFVREHIQNVKIIYTLPEITTIHLDVLDRETNLSIYHNLYK